MNDIYIVFSLGKMCICHLRMCSSRITYSTVQSNFEVILSSIYIWRIFQTKEKGNYLLQCNYLLLKLRKHIKIKMKALIA